MNVKYFLSNFLTTILLIFFLFSCKSAEKFWQDLERLNSPTTISPQTTGSVNTNDQNTTSKTPAPNLSPPPVDPSATGESFYLKEVIPIINEERKNGKTCGDDTYVPTSELVWDDDLAEAALEHAADLSYHRGMRGHRGSDSTRVIERIRRHSTDFNNFAENVVVGRISPENTVSVFFNSPGHCRNNMNPIYTHIGAAQHFNPDTGRTATVYKFGRKR